MRNQSKHSSAEANAKLSALDRSQAVIEFSLDGIVLAANDNFLHAMGYTLEEIRGRHHRLFVEPEYAKSQEYQDFWKSLAGGNYQAAEYKRIGKNGREIWIAASYNPVLDAKGNPCKVIKFATDVTKEKQATSDYVGQISALNKAQAVIEFNLDGTIIGANQNFLDAVGYSLDEIRGRHHRMFADEDYAASAEYKQFWEKLNRGEFEAAQYRRFGKGGREIWIEASYNPILDPSGKPYKVVKFATDITKQKLRQADVNGQIEAIGKSQAVIHFNMDGTILTANANFLQAMGYELSEIQGRHHRMFADPAYAESREYAEFWKRLNQGEFQAGEYKRLGKNGREVWILASYNPIFDMNGKPFKVVKYATEISGQMNARLQVGTLISTTLANVEGVAAAAEELNASIAEISKNMGMSKAAVDDIIHKTSLADDAARQLVDNSRSMENVVELIRDIAGQVNLLALNATIEAARAGEAGRGFAVVAAEVKNLASQARTATDEIARKIHEMQSVSSAVTDSVGAIGKTTDSVSEYVNSVASAIEEQSAVTQEISGNMQRTAQGIGDINACVKQISAAS